MKDDSEDLKLPISSYNEDSEQLEQKPDVDWMLDNPENDVSKDSDYPCAHCGESFTSKGEWKTHMKTVHKVLKYIISHSELK